jgi:hypothetical protein
MKQTQKFFVAGLVGLALTVMTAHAIAGQAPVTGAIFTTGADGAYVNANIYGAKEEVYLNGGPQPNAPCTAAGLPDGQYYFQVTDPSGKVLLSTDSIQARNVEVLGGVIVGLGLTGTHGMLPTGQCGSMTVELMPFAGTPNPGGEYKVWMTPVGEYIEGSGSFGFLPRKSKTDNFKAPSTVDTDGDGQPDDIDTDDDNDTIPDNEDRCPFDPEPSCVEG